MLIRSLPLVFCLAAAVSPSLAAQSGPAAQSWLDLSGEIQFRVQALDGQFRSDRTLADSDSFAVQRTLLRADADLDKAANIPFTFSLEIGDMRQYGAGSGSGVSTAQVNAVDLLQAAVEIPLGTSGGGKHSVRLGRLTMDVGSRRMISRNRWRTTINGFTGVDYSWNAQDESGSALRLFWLMPVRRLPSDRPSLVDNDIESDEESIEDQFFGFHRQTEIAEDWKFESFTYVRNEFDDNSLRRRLATPGLRLSAPAAVNEYDVDIEAAGQFGNSRLTRGGPDLNHIAYFLSAKIGYTFDLPWQPQLRFGYDLQSGDRDPNDNKNNRYDALFGAQRPLGPTENFFALRWQNLSSPEVRLRVKPRDDLWAYLSYRRAWLQSSRDAWVPARVQDPTGAAGSFIGDLFEIRSRYTAIPKCLLFEAGVAVFLPGSFAGRAPNGRGRGTATFGYLQANLLF